MATVTPLSPAVGARIDGIDLSRPLAEADFDALQDALHAHGYIVLKRQSLTPRGLVEFARRWGRPQPHVIDTFHHPDDANVLVLSNVHKDGKPTGLVDAGTYFHSDYSYLEQPARCTILHARDVPAGRNGTIFANQRSAYADLPAERRRQIDGLVVRHHYGNRDDLDKGSRTVASVLSAAQEKKVGWVRHPLVRRHPYTGEPALYAVSGSSFGIDGLADDEGLALLRELAAHATQERYCHTNDYDNGDVIVWDNALLLHSAPLIDLSRPRTLWRVTVMYQ